MTEVKITKYQSDDGKIFNTKEECINYEKEMKAIDLLKRKLHGVREMCEGQVDCDPCPFSDGNGTCLISGAPLNWKF